MRLLPCLFLCHLVFLSPLLAQTGSEGKVHQLPEEKAAQTISLNPDYYVFGESLAKNDEDLLPLLIVLHGAGGIGTNIEQGKSKAVRLLGTIAEAEIKTIVVAPQASKNPMKVGPDGGWIPSDLNALLAHLLETLPIDPDRVYLTGNSMGGYGTFAWSGVNPEHFAAIAPMVGGLGALGPKDITPDLALWGKNIATLPMKAYFGAQDHVVPADRGEMILKAIQKAGGDQAEIIVYEDMGHNAGQRPYSDPEFFRWLFSHQRSDS